jgi:hypothetical protein
MKETIIRIRSMNLDHLDYVFNKCKVFLEDNNIKNDCVITIKLNEEKKDER